MTEENIQFNDDWTFEDEGFYIDEDGIAVIDDSAITLLGIGNCDDLTMHKVGDWIPCASVDCETQFQLRQWWCGITDGDGEENEPWQDGGKDGLRFVCYECAKDAYRHGVISPATYALLERQSSIATCQTNGESKMIIELNIFDETLLNVGVPQNRIADCLRWAAGDDIDTLDLDGFCDSWNERHGDLFIIEEDSLITIDEAVGEIGLSYLRQMET